jgi:outer membrane protein assembly factor BamB
LTNLRSPLVRKYRRTLISVAISGMILGMVTWATPFFMRRLNPDQSRLTSIDRLSITHWDEPVSNPDSNLADDEIDWLKNIPYKFKYKLNFDFEFKQAITIYESTLVLLDQKGNLRGFNAYTGLNHWSIALGIRKVVSQFQVQKKLYLLDYTQSDALRVSCLDLQNPSVLWQRTIPNSKEGEISFDLDAQIILVTTGSSGVWALRAKTGEILWKRPEIYTKTMAIPSPKHILVFEPVVAKKLGAWYFLDPQTGKTIQKNAHVYPEIEEFMAVDPEHTLPESFLAKIQSQQIFYMNHLDLHQVWSFNVTEPISLTQVIDADRYFIVYDSKTVEQRHLKNNEIIWQKKMSETSGRWLKITPDKQFLILPNVTRDESPGVSFYRMDTGDYLFTAKTSEAITDMSFYGDWFYLFSENHLWAFQKAPKP